MAFLDRVVYTRPNLVRPGWRILVFVLAGLAASNVGVPLLAMAFPAAAMVWVRPTLECVAVLVATRFALMTFERQGWEGVALGRSAWTFLPLFAGAAAGALAIALPIGLLVSTGDLRFVAAPVGSVPRALLLSVAVLAPAALTEELLLRGYPFAVLSARWGWPVATGVTSIVFGLLHLGNPGVTPLAIANVISAGLFLAGVRLVTGSLAAAWAAHFAWNWTMSAGFHTAVSGLPFETPGYRLVDSGPDWLSGGAWGPEGGAVAVVGMIGTFAGLSWAAGRTRRAGQWPGAPVTVSMHAGGRDDHQEHDT